MLIPRRVRWLLVALVLAAPMAIAFALMIGSVALEPGTVWHSLRGGDTGLARTLVMELRLPRALAAFAVGALLAVAGALLQVLLRNPLADPYILGVSGGAAVGALLALTAGLGALAMNAGALAGAAISMLLVFGLARGRGAWTPVRLLLTGVVVAAGWGAVISLMLALAADTTLSGMLFWLMGDLSRGARPWGALAVLAVTLAVLAPRARALNLLARGPLVAASLGENPARLHGVLYLSAGLLTATAVSVAGTVGFVGLIVPHLLRLLGATDHRILLPACALLGGTLLVVADALARTVLAPQQLPVGVITAMIGVPVFLFLLQRMNRG